jgi:hypothetical protein
VFAENGIDQLRYGVVLVLVDELVVVSGWHWHYFTYSVAVKVCSVPLSDRFFAPAAMSHRLVIARL